MLSASSISLSARLSVDTPQQTHVSDAETVLQEQKESNPTSKCADTPHLSQLNKSEINDAVTKVLEGYDWTLVPIASK